MPTANFYLKDRNSKNETDIYLQFNFNYFEIDNQKKKYLKLRYFTGEKINPKYWNFEKQRAKETSKFRQYPEFNQRLQNITDVIFNIYRNIVNNNKIPTREILKEKLLIYFERQSKPTKEHSQDSLIEFIYKFISENERSKGKSTISVYRTTLKHLQNYVSKKRLKTINFEHINLDFYNSFVDYLSNDLNLSENTVGKYIKTLKTFLNDATERNFNTNLAYKSKKFKSYNEPTEQIYLTEKELTALYDLDLNNNKRLDKVRDLFLVGCYTALRFSDFSRIKKENIIENGTMLKFTTKKTNEIVYIPIHYRVLEIFKKYDNTAPPTISNQKMNKYIKEVGKLAGIDSVIMRSIKKKDLIIDMKFKKYKLITTHTARRSGATNMFKSGIPPINIMKITGHRTEKAFMRYIRITQEENAKTLLNHKYFKKPLEVVVNK